MTAAIASIPADAWTAIHYPNAFVDPDTGELVSDAEVAEVPYTAFTGRRVAEQVTARMIVRRVKRLNPATAAGQGELFAVYRYHCCFTDSPLPLIDAEAAHRGHAIIEQTIADLKAGPLAHLPSGSFAANSAWLVLAAIAFNLTVLPRPVIEPGRPTVSTVDGRQTAGGHARRAVRLRHRRRSRPGHRRPGGPRHRHRRRPRAHGRSGRRRRPPASAGLGADSRSWPADLGVGGHRQLRRRTGRVPRRGRRGRRGGCRGQARPRAEERPDRRGARGPRGAFRAAAGQSARPWSAGGAASSPHHPARGAGQPHEGHQRAEEPDRGRLRAPARRTARPLTRPTTRAYREADRPARSHRRGQGDRAGAALGRRPDPLPVRAGPALLAEPGVGPVVAAQLLVSWSHRGRVRNEAAFAALAGTSPLEASSGGQRVRHRLNRGGDRDLNRALHTVAITRMRCHPETRAHHAKRTAQGKTHRDIRRALKRALARRLYRRIQAATRPPAHPAST